MNASFLNLFLNRHFPTILIISFVLGLWLPGVDQIPSVTLAVLLSIQIFFSCFKINLAEIQEIRIFKVGIFTLLRFVIFPALFYGLTRDWLGAYGVAVFLLLLLPAGVSSPAIAGILGGNISLSILLLILSSLLAPFVIPLLFATLTGQRLDINPLELFYSLSLMVFCPLLLHLPLRRFKNLKMTIQENNALLVLPLLAIDMIIAIAKRREFFFDHLGTSFLSFFIVLGIYLTLFFLAWTAVRQDTYKSRISYAIASSLNNIVLGIVLALLYFPFEVGMFMIVANMAWILAMVPFKWWSHKMS